MRHSTADAIAAAAEVAVGKGDQRSGSIPRFSGLVCPPLSFMATNHEAESKSSDLLNGVAGSYWWKKGSRRVAPTQIRKLANRYSIDTVHNSLTHYFDFRQMVTKLPLDLSSVVRTRSKSSRQHSAQVFNNASANVVPVGEAT